MPLPPARSPGDIPWEALAAHLAGELAGVERHAVEQWLAADPAHEELFALLQRGWQANGASRRRYDAEAALQRIKAQPSELVPASAPAPLRTPVRLVPPARRAFGRASRALLAASLAAVAAGGWWLTSRGGAAGMRAGVGQTAEWGTEYRTARGQYLSLLLPDGSAVVLGPASVLRVAAAYGKPARVVALEGDAHFSVEHDTARPFSVRAPHALLRDLGTHFVVQAHPEDRVSDVVVTEGRVAMGRASGSRTGDLGVPLSSDSLVLAAGYRGRLTETGALVASADARLDDYRDWGAGRVVFSDTPVPDALRRVARAYDVRVVVADSTTEAALARRTVSATFRGESAAEVLRLIAATLALRVERDSLGFSLRSITK